MLLLLQLFFLLLHGLPLLRSEPLVAVHAEVVALVVDDLRPLGRVCLVVQQPVLVVHRSLILGPGVARQLLVKHLGLLVLLVEHHLLLIRHHEVAAEETGAGALLDTDDLATREAVVDKGVSESLTVAELSPSHLDALRRFTILAVQRHKLGLLGSIFATASRLYCLYGRTGLFRSFLFLFLSSFPYIFIKLLLGFLVDFEFHVLD